MIAGIDIVITGRPKERGARDGLVAHGAPGHRGTGAPGPIPTERLSMRNTREILRQKWLLKRSHRDIAKAVSVSMRAVSVAASRAAETHVRLTGENVLQLGRCFSTRP